MPFSFKVAPDVEAASNPACIAQIASVAKQYDLPVEILTPVNSAVYDWAPDGYQLCVYGSVGIGTWCGQVNVAASVFFQMGTNDVSKRMAKYVALQTAPVAG
jgi:hypothetical protein